MRTSSSTAEGRPAGVDRPAEPGQGLRIRPRTRAGLPGVVAVEADRLAGAPAHPRADELQAGGDRLVSACSVVGRGGGRVQESASRISCWSIACERRCSEERDRLAGEGLERAPLLVGEVARLRSRTQSVAERMAVPGDELLAGIEANRRIRDDERVIGEAVVGGSVRNDEKLVLEDRVRAEGDVAVRPSSSTPTST